MNHKILLLLSILSLVFVSGCLTENNILNMAKASPIIQNFLEDYPNAEINMQLISESVVQADIDFVAECESVNASEYYKVVLTDPSSGLRAFAFVDSKVGVVCAFKEGTSLENITCSDSDGGINYYEKGYAKLDLGHGATTGDAWDFCYDSSYLNEYYCKSNSEMEIQGFQCPNGCNNGACIQEITCYTDGDCGTSTTTRYCSGDSACTNTTTYTCSNPGTEESSCIIAGGGGCGSCAYGCQDGYCMSEPNQTIECYTNNDCGTSITTKYCSGNSACTNSTTYTCSNPGTEESSCIIAGGVGCGSCPHGCEDGECLGADTTAPEITIVSPENDSTVTNSSITVSVNTNEEATCKSKYIVYTGGGAGMTSWLDMDSTDGLQHTRSTTVGDGNQYTYYINCTDNSGNSNEITLFFDADLGIPPNVTITHPENNTNATFTPVAVSATTDEIATCEHKATVCMPAPECNENEPCGGPGCGGTGWIQMKSTGTIAHSHLYNLTDTYSYTVYVRCTDAHNHTSDVLSVSFIAILG